MKTVLKALLVIAIGLGAVFGAIAGIDYLSSSENSRQSGHRN